jgi:hypothetical protein
LFGAKKRRCRCLARKNGGAVVWREITAVHLFDAKNYGEEE